MAYMERPPEFQQKRPVERRRLRALAKVPARVSIDSVPRSPEGCLGVVWERKGIGAQVSPSPLSKSVPRGTHPARGGESITPPQPQPFAGRWVTLRWTQKTTEKSPLEREKAQR